MSDSADRQSLTLSCALVRVDAHGHIAECSQAAREILGPGCRLGANIAALVDPPGQPLVLEALAAAAECEIAAARGGKPVRISIFPAPSGAIAVFRHARVGLFFDDFAQALTHALMSPDSKTYFDRLAHVVGSALGADRVVIGQVYGHPIRRVRVLGQWMAENEEGRFPLLANDLSAVEALSQDSDLHWVEGDRQESSFGGSFLNRGAYRGYVRAMLKDSLDSAVGVLEIGSGGILRSGGLPQHVVEVIAACAAIELSRLRETKEADVLVGDLRQRMRELSCFYGLTESLRTRGSLSEVCEDLAHLIPEVWQFPDIARSRVVIDGEVHLSQPFKDTNWGMSAAIMAGGRARGSLQVFYTENRAHEGGTEPFLPAERKLLDALARTLGEAIEKREAEAEIRKQSIVLAQERNRLETILRSIGDGVVVTDNADRILLLNPAAQELLNLRGDEGLGKAFLGFIPDSAFRKAWTDAGTAQTQPFKHDFHVSGPVDRAITATRTRVPDLVQGMAGSVTILHDVTKERHIDQMKTDFVSSITHELRTPMTSIKGFAATLLRSPSIEPERRTRFLSIIGQEADRLLGMIEELLLISRIESGAMFLEPAEVEFDSLVHRVVAALEPLIAKKALVMELDIHPQLPKILGDEEKLRIIVYNLLGNAVKFTGDEGNIWVKAWADETDLFFQVADSGIGIPEADKDRVFHRFYRVHRPGSAHPGTGLGLFITREIVALHGGAIALESEVGKGARFTVRLPRKGPAEAPPIQAESGASA